MGQCLKYLWRFRLKGTPIQDLEKAAWYLERLMEGAKDGTQAMDLKYAKVRKN